MKNIFKMRLLILIILSFILTANIFSQTEEQRKYIFPEINENILKVVAGEANLEGLTIKKHSIFDYYDIYLDTDNRDIMKNKMSLRIRKRDLGDNKIEYTIQLKSEMLKPSDIRMEIDEPELDHLKVYDQGKVIHLKDVLAKIFERFEFLINQNNQFDLTNDQIILQQLDVLNVWLDFKMTGPIAPFQKLRHLKIPLEKLKTLKAYMIGHSNRVRSHVYIDRNNTVSDLENFPASERAESEVPEEIQGGNFIWTMETSFDQAEFYSTTIPFAVHIINEFEVENKYLPSQKSLVLLNQFEMSLKSELNAQVNLESKYLQSMKAFGF